MASNRLTLRMILSTIVPVVGYVCMFVCVCHRINDQQIRDLARDGASTLEELKAQTSLGQSCGCCLEEAERVLYEEGGRPTMPGSLHSVA